MSREELDRLEAASRAVQAALSLESTRSTCPTHGKTVRG
jgi:hypothetical protein